MTRAPNARARRLRVCGGALERATFGGMQRLVTMLHEIFQIEPPEPVETRARRLVQQAISMAHSDDREPRYRRDDGELAQWTDLGGES